MGHLRMCQHFLITRDSYLLMSPVIWAVLASGFIAIPGVPGTEVSGCHPRDKMRMKALKAR